jgi:hypothetical protein
VRAYLNLMESTKGTQVQPIMSPQVTTTAREATVPVAPLLQEILAKYRIDRNYPPVEGGWMFYGSKEKKPMDMDNLSRREIPQFINGVWREWNAFRPGLG